MGNMGSLPDGTVTFLLTDVEASTRLWEAHPGAAAEMVDRQRELIAAAVLGRGGARPVEQGEGDSVVAAFARPTDAIEAALDAQRAIAAEAWAVGPGVRVRMAIHTGAVELRADGTYAGAALNRCARLRALGHGGQVLLSGATADLARDDIAEPVELMDLGSHRLRDLGRPERVFQLRAPGLEEAHPPLRSLDATPNNLPAELSSFVGRDEEVTLGVRLLRETRLLTITGSGGCGKTRLALRIAAEVADGFPHGTWWVELAPLTSGALVAERLASAVGLKVPAGRDALEAVIEHLGGGSSLVVLDNCEHLVDEVARLTHALLSRCVETTVLATSREPMAVEGEVTWRVPSLSLPPDDVAGDTLEQFDAVRLFIERAVQARPNFRVDNTNAPAVAQICHQLDGIPLAIELAAARVRSLPPERILEALRDRFRLLAGGNRVALPRQQTLWASVDWSHELLDAQERALLRRLSVFAGGFELDAAEAVVASEPLQPYEVLDGLDRLVEKSLLQVDDHTPTGRYRLLETIRHYGLERLEQTGELDATSDRLLVWARELVAEHETAVMFSRVEALDALDAEHANIRAALDWALVARPDDALHLVAGLAMFWVARGHYADAATFVPRALELTSADPALHARVRWGGAFASFYASDVLGAREQAELALETARSVGDDATAARCLHTLGAATWPSDPASALEILDESIELARAVGDEWCESDALQMRALATMLRGSLTAAREDLDAAIVIARRFGGLSQEAWHHYGLAIIATLRGEITESVALAEDCRRVARLLGDPAVESASVVIAAGALMGIGRLEEGAELLDELQSASRDWGLFSTIRLTSLLTIAATHDHPSRAGRELAELAEGFFAAGIHYEAAFVLPIAAFAALDAGELDEARARALAVLAHEEFPFAAVGAKTALAAVERATGGEAGDDFVHDALTIIEREEAYLYLPQSLAVLAGLALDGGSVTEATRLLAASEAIGDGLGRRRSPAEQAIFDADVAAACGELGQDAFDVAWSEGAALGPGEALAYARRARGERGRPSHGWASLTPTEQQVVDLVAEGLTNPQIAARLLVGRETVKTHLTHVFTKLGVSNRTELATAVIERRAR